MISIQTIYAYFGKDSSAWVKATWWGAFIAEKGDVADSVIAVKDACDTCKANHKVPPAGDCATAALNAVKYVIMNIVTLTVGWNAPGAINNLLIDGQYKRSLVGDESNSRFSSGSPLFNSASS